MADSRFWLLSLVDVGWNPHQDCLPVHYSSHRAVGLHTWQLTSSKQVSQEKLVERSGPLLFQHQKSYNITQLSSTVQNSHKYNLIGGDGTKIHLLGVGIFKSHYRRACRIDVIVAIFEKHNLTQVIFPCFSCGETEAQGV